jgi:hypothetical protein
MALVHTGFRTFDVGDHALGPRCRQVVLLMA